MNIWPEKKEKKNREKKCKRETKHIKVLSKGAKPLVIE